MVTFAACGSKEELSLWAIDFGGWVAGIHLMVELRW